MRVKMPQGFFPCFFKQKLLDTVPRNTVLKNFSSSTEEYWPCNATVFYFCSGSFLVILTKDAAEIMICTALSYKDLNAIQSPVLCHEFPCTVLQVLCTVQKPNS